MKSADLNSRLIDSYIELLKNLSASAKLELITKLKASIKNSPQKKSAFDKAFGAWDKSDDPGKLVNLIREARHFDRKIADL